MAAVAHHSLDGFPRLIVELNALHGISILSSTARLPPLPRAPPSCRVVSHGVADADLEPLEMLGIERVLTRKNLGFPRKFREHARRA